MLQDLLGARVLLVEDDPALRNIVIRGLRELGAVVTAVGDGSAALTQVSGGRPPFDAIVLDVGLPDSDGRDVCHAMRARGIRAGVLFLTARGDMVDVLSGFAAGGDEYVAKPFHFPELAARLAAVLRRGTRTPAETGGLTLDPRTHSLSLGPSAAQLSPTEFRLLAVLLGAPGTVVRRRELVRAGWPDGALVHENTVDQYLTRLRRKLRSVAPEATISTVHGVGYRFG